LRLRAAPGILLGPMPFPDSFVVAVTLPVNARSRRVMEKVGMTYDRDWLHADIPHVLYRVRFTSLPAPPPPA